jgi:hypothetical protein
MELGSVNLRWKLIWEPWQKQQINKIEMIQRRAARYTLNQYSYHSSVSAMLQPPLLRFLFSGYVDDFTFVWVK